MAHDFESMGFANPRGLPYHNVEVVLKKFSGDSVAYVPLSITRTRGWILPGQKTFIAWNGWVYPIHKLKGKADWQADALELVQHGKEDEAQRQKNKLKAPSGKFSFGAFNKKTQVISWRNEGPFTNRVRFLWPDSLDVYKVVMLELLGEEELAGRLWDLCDTDRAKQARWQNQNWHRPKPEQVLPTLPYRFELALDWVLLGYQETIPLTAGADDAAALSRLRILAQACGVIGENDRIHGDNIRWLRDDYERRVAENVVPHDTNSMAFLIWDLQNVGTYTQKDIRQDARFRRIVARGDEAIEPLIHTLTYDQRISRQVDTRIPNILINVSMPTSVWGVAAQALGEILHKDYVWIFHEILFNDLELTAEELRMVPTEGGVDERKVLVGIIRADWEKVRAIPPKERPYEILRDDNAGVEEWQKAAKLIVEQKEPEAPVRWRATVPSYREEPMWGESLRSKRNPSVSELLARRSDEQAKNKLEPRRSVRTRGRIPFNLAVEFALLLHKWDREASSPVVLARMRELAELDDEARKSRPNYAGNLRRLLAAAPPVEGGEIYGNWLRTSPRIGSSFTVFNPLLNHLEDPFWQKLAADIFSNPSSPWSCVLSPSQPFEDAQSIYNYGIPWTIPSLNTVLRRDLANKNVVGTMTWNQEGYLRFEKEGTETWSSSLSKEQRAQVKSPQGKVPLRLCDLIAYAFFSYTGRSPKTPRFSIIASEKKRDSQIQKMTSWIASQSGKMSRRGFYSTFS